MRYILALYSKKMMLIYFLVGMGFMTQQKDLQDFCLHARQVQMDSLKNHVQICELLQHKQQWFSCVRSQMAQQAPYSPCNFIVAQQQWYRCDQSPKYITKIN